MTTSDTLYLSAAIVAGLSIAIFIIKRNRMKEQHFHFHHHYDEIKTVLSKLDLIIKNQEKMAQELESLTTEVQETKGIMASAKVLIEGFARKLEEAGTDKVKLAALKDELNTGSEDLAAAIAANPLPTENVEQPPQ